MFLKVLPLVMISSTADVDELVEVDIATAKITNKYTGYGSVCMNDVTADKYGNVYVGDTYNDTIYRLNQFGQLSFGFTVLSSSKRHSY